MLEIYTPSQVAERWDCDVERVLALIKAGRLKAFTLSDPTCRRPRWKVTSDALKAFESGEPAKQPSQRPRRPSNRDTLPIKKYF